MSCRARSGQSMGQDDLPTTEEFGVNREPILKSFSRARPPRQQRITQVVPPISQEATEYGTSEFAAPALDREPILKNFSRAKPPRQQRVPKVVAPISQGASEFGNSEFGAPALDREPILKNFSRAKPPRQQRVTQVVAPISQGASEYETSEPNRIGASVNKPVASTPSRRMSLPVVPGPPPPLALRPEFSNKTPLTSAVPSSEPDTLQPQNLQVKPDAFVKDELVAGLNKNNFEPFLKSKEAALVFFYDPFNMSSYYPNTQIKQAAKETTRNNHAYAAVNCTLEGELCLRQGIEQLPTFKLFSNGVTVSTIRFLGSFDAKTMKSYVEKTPVMEGYVAAQRACANENAAVTAGTQKTRTQLAKNRPTQAEITAASQNLKKTKNKK